MLLCPPAAVLRSAVHPLPNLQQRNLDAQVVALQVQAG